MKKVYTDSEGYKYNMVKGKKELIDKNIIKN